ncbi:MAG: PepSY domain-containing protein [Rhodospirillum sp.]|nr:PepSY domain-containing protein [Rhodospirillum sp.]MCF8490230.1 PepSY domain-containing protein [Rhodospirillum sp.]MCF8500993.1 PepSY domain-containing protein [Rhodospirillum sp.]
MNANTSRADLPSALYRAVWRWHFYAGLIILPVMILMAATGGLYLFKDEINDLVFHDLRLVGPVKAAPLSPSTLTAQALEAHPGEVKAYMPPAAPDRSAQVTILGKDGLKDNVFVNPYSGQVLGSDWDGGAAGSELMWVVRKMHSLEYVGWLGNRIVEAVAGWAVLLTGTGLYLWWPRGRKGGVLLPRKTSGRPFWRDLHAVTGLYTAGFIVFLAMTGLPWSGVWGKWFYDLSYAVGIGMPDGYWSNFPTSTVPLGEAVDRAPWILERQPMPLSGAAEGVPVGLDRVVATVESRGIHPGYSLSMPKGAEGVFTASVYPDDITQERVIHLDQYTGEVLYDLGLKDLGTLGRAAEWGISIHMGQAFGLVNQIVLLLACLSIVSLSVFGVMAWWKRRPKGSLGAPRYARDLGVPTVVLGLCCASAILFPLVGLSMAVFAVVEVLIGLRSRLRLAAERL